MLPKKYRELSNRREKRVQHDYLSQVSYGIVSTDSVTYERINAGNTDGTSWRAMPRHIIAHLENEIAFTDGLPASEYGIILNSVIS